MSERSDSDFEFGAEERRKKPKVVVWVVSAAGVLILGSGLIAWIIADRLDNRGTDGAVPLVEAEAEPFKVKPEEPGGMEVPNQDKLVYEQMNGEGAGQLEQLLPPSEEPFLSESDAAQAAAALEQGVAPAAEGQDQQAQPESSLPSVAEAVVGAEAAGESVAVEENSPNAAGEEQPSVAEESPEPASQDLAVIEPEPASVVPVPSASGEFAVQVAAVKNEEAAEKEAKRLMSAEADLLGGTISDIQSIDLGADKGVFYRVRFGYFDRGAADSLCGDLKARGVDCIVAKK